MKHNPYYIAVIVLSALLLSCSDSSNNGPALGTGSTTLSWDAPSQNTDNSTLNDLARFVIYYGPASGTLDYSVNVNDPTATSYSVENLVKGTSYIFAMTAVNSSGVESDQSNIITRTISQ